MLDFQVEWSGNGLEFMAKDLWHLCFHEALVESSSPFGGEIPHGMVAGHCLAPFGLWSFGLGSLPASMLLGCWPLSCSFWPCSAGESFGQESLRHPWFPYHLVRRFRGMLHSEFKWLCCLSLGLLCRSFACCSLSLGDHGGVCGCSSRASA